MFSFLQIAYDYYHLFYLFSIFAVWKNLISQYINSEVRH